MEPLNYQFVDPNAAIMNGLKLGAAQNQIAQQQQAQALALQQAQQQQADLRALAMKQNAGAADYAAMMTKYPGLSEHLGKAYKLLDDDQQKNLLNFQSRVYAAQQSGNNDLAVQLLRERAKADPSQAQHYNVMADLVEKSPSTARSITALSLASAMGPDKFAAAYQNLGTEARAEQKQPLEVAELTGKAQEALAKGGAAVTRANLENQNIASQIQDRAGRLALDRDTLTSNVQTKLLELNQKATTLDDGAKKIINDSAIASVAAEQSAGQMTDLADRLDKERAAGGTLAAGLGSGSTVSEWIKGATGNQDALTQMRQEYVRLRNTAALKMLPPGPASDKDIQVAMKGFPPDTADAEYLASFLRGMAKLQQRESVVENARAEWVNAVGHSGKPKTDIEVDGVKVPAGTSFTDFMRSYTPKAVQQRDAQAVAGRSYMRWASPQSAATPAPAAGGVRDRVPGLN